ncbi:hypothetical protein [Clostridium isatidis]|uniref:Uncharacterized protein n=1 Tax=Clostridium isatidis TaxID=182773 RepID=A0A343JB00_9CLOT|nr:hypothetical protein [Clostridium isatidis]ASW42708.1 hypothetical protein BEN51_04215 [Clostridium isatidis]NLZ34413.1 hypothetical protein [Clostridiales bacterium]
MDIQKEKIEEIYDNTGRKVVKYKQKIINNTLKEEKEIVSKDLNSLISEVRKQLNEWNNMN